MSSAEGPGGSHDPQSGEASIADNASIERQLFESLVHHLIEKGVLTKNDAMSVVQTVAEVKRGEAEAGPAQAAAVKRHLSILERLYSSFELINERRATAEGFDGENVLQLRPPLHGDNPRFPKDD